MTSKQSDLWPAWSTSTGWWLSPTPLKNDGVKVSWDYEIPNLWKNKKCIKMFQTTNQSRLNQNLSHTCCESLPFDFRLVADAALKAFMVWNRVRKPKTVPLPLVSRHFPQAFLQQVSETRVSLATTDSSPLCSRFLAPFFWTFFCSLVTSCHSAEETWMDTRAFGERNRNTLKFGETLQTE